MIWDRVFNIHNNRLKRLFSRGNDPIKNEVNTNKKKQGHASMKKFLRAHILFPEYLGFAPYFWVLFILPVLSLTSAIEGVIILPLTNSRAISAI